MKKYEFTIEDLNCYTITLEVEDHDDPDLEGDAAWDAFNNLKECWYNHPTRVDIENGCNVDIQMYGPIKETEDD